MMNEQQIIAQLKKTAKWSAAGFVGLFFGMSTWFTTSEGYIYYVQNKLTGNTEVYSEPGLHLKMPLFTNIYEYKRVATIDMSADVAGEFTRDLDAIGVTFADTYGADVPMTFRFRLPIDENNFRKLHQEFRSFENLVDALLVSNARNVAVVTATQYTGEEFIQGGVNSYKAQMEDQLRNGLYVTKREQVEVKDSGYAPVSSTNSDSKKVEETTRLVMKNVIQVDDKTGRPKRLENPMAQYGIEVSQVSVAADPIPDEQLDKLLGEKRKLVGKKISAQQQIETNQAEAEAAKQEREIEKQRAIQDAQKQKELAIIGEQQQTEVERQRALKETVQREKEKSLAVIDKQRELEVAQANRGIQEAAAEAARFEADAIKAKGLAEAEVERAKLAAKQSAAAIYMAEIQRDIAQVMYPALKDVNIDMPDFYSGATANGQAPTSLDVFTTLGALKELQDRKPEEVK
jgi:regulator of protease activity HflC (stomatin/prohibitin superfamily)